MGGHGTKFSFSLAKFTSKSASPVVEQAKSNAIERFLHKSPQPAKFIQLPEIFSFSNIKNNNDQKLLLGTIGGMCPCPTPIREIY